MSSFECDRARMAAHKDGIAPASTAGPASFAFGPTTLPQHTRRIIYFRTPPNAQRDSSPLADRRCHTTSLDLHLNLNRRPRQFCIWTNDASTAHPAHHLLPDATKRGDGDNGQPGDEATNAWALPSTVSASRDGTRRPWRPPCLGSDRPSAAWAQP